MTLVLFSSQSYFATFFTDANTNSGKERCHSLQLNSPQVSLRAVNQKSCMEEMLQNAAKLARGIAWEKCILMPPISTEKCMIEMLLNAAF